MIECLNINKTFCKKQVLNNVSMKIENNKITSLIGSNGAGKSTLIGIIMQYYKLDSGTIHKKSISIMPDADSLYDDLTGYDFLLFMSRLKKLSSIDEALCLANSFKLSDYLNKTIKSYSFGMKKKIGFIQACIGLYDCYIFDEPTSGVDEPSAVMMMEIVQKLKNQGAAILLTSHNLDELERVSDYIYIISEGVITHFGTVNEVISFGETNNYDNIYILKSEDAIKILEISILTFPSIRIIDYKTLEVKIKNYNDFQKFVKHILDMNYRFTELYIKKKTLRESIYQKN